MAFNPAGFAAEGEIRLQSVEAEAVPVQAPFLAKTEALSLPESALFTLEGEDLIAWEEHAAEGLLYFEVIPEKNEEIALLATENRGKPMQINFGQDFVIVPEISGDFLQKNGFILMMGDSERKAFIYSVLEWPKKREPLTPVTLEKKEPVPDESL